MHFKHDTIYYFFTSDLPEILDTGENEPAKIGNDIKLSSILWADD